MKQYPFISTIRYMGNKAKLLGEIIPKIESVTKEGDVVCDLMAGTNSIGYALKKRNIIYSNDIQNYSYTIAGAMLDNYDIPSLLQVHEDIDKNYNANLMNKTFNFFQKNYTDTYFSGRQCEEIDSLRFAIENITDKSKRCLYLTMLMNAMCKAQSTTGHFAQYMDKSHYRIIPLRALSIHKLFFDKLSDFDSFVRSKYTNKEFNLDYNELLKLPEIKDVSCFYLDSPYTLDQYSRFYHILETVSKYDNPTLDTHKAKYRTDRVQSNFCYKKTVAAEFNNIFSQCSEFKKPMVVSYSNHGVIEVPELVNIAKKYYKKVDLTALKYDHSSQGKGTININEIILVLEA